MKTIAHCLTACSVFALLSSAACVADEKIYTDPAKAGEDFKIQGEYSGNLEIDGEKLPFALQVIALGDHKFDGVAYVGGLPGAGAVGDVNAHAKASGSTKDGVTKLTSDEGFAVIKDGKAEIQDIEGKVVGTLKKANRKSATLGKKPPSGALVLFDGSTADHFKNGKVVDGKHLAADCETKEKFDDYSLHLEFRTPFKPHARGQARGNSGVYLQGRYECQVLDSFGLEGKDNECGGIYQIAEPNVNACFPPLSWQSYDIDFTAARWDDGKKVANARVTIRHNDILIHDDLELPHATPGKYPEAEGPGPIYLQGHGNPVVYRNIWIVKK